MKKELTKAALAISVIALAACGGGGGSTGPAPTPTPPPAPGPGPAPTPTPPPGPAPTPTPPPAPDPIKNFDDMSMNELVDFARAGFGRNFHGVTRFTNSVYRDGADQSVRLDILPGYGHGLITVMDGSNSRIFTLTGQPVVTPMTPNGVYAGEMEITYRMTESGEWLTMFGNMFMEIDMRTGKVATDSISGNTVNNVEFMGEARYANGRITSDEMRVHVRDGEGAYMFGGDFGSVDAIVATGSDTSAIFGTIGAEHENGFQMKGGILLPYRPEYN